jgi:hypothetical protein
MDNLNIDLKSADIAPHEIVAVTNSNGTEDGNLFVLEPTARTVPVWCGPDIKAASALRREIRFLKIRLFIFQLRLYRAYLGLQMANLILRLGGKPIRRL